MGSWDEITRLPVGLRERSLHVSLEESKAAHISSIIISLISMCALAVCFSRRVQRIGDWRELPFVSWLVLLIYLDSMSFVAGTTILSNGFGLASSAEMCSTAILLCLGCYMTTKLLYYFLVERVYIVRRSSKPRMRDPLYLFNSFGMLVPYLVVIILNFYFRFAIYEDGKCLIGMKRVAMIPLIAFDVFVNVYLTSLFLLPLRATWSYQNNRTSGVRTVALRTFIGSCATLVSSVVNLSLVAGLSGEPSWLCLMLCNAEILFSVLVLHWITSKDKPTSIVISGPSKVKARSTPRSNPQKSASHHDVLEYQFKLKEDRKSRGVVTTLVSAAHEEEEFDRITYPENAITVERTHTIEVIDIEAEASSERESHKGFSGSMDKFFGKF